MVDLPELRTTSSGGVGVVREPVSYAAFLDASGVAARLFDVMMAEAVGGARRLLPRRFRNVIASGVAWPTKHPT
jgi:hypothetical protein